MAASTRTMRWAVTALLFAALPEQTHETSVRDADALRNAYAEQSRATVSDANALLNAYTEQQQKTHLHRHHHHMSLLETRVGAYRRMRRNIFSHYVNQTKKHKHTTKEHKHSTLGMLNQKHGLHRKGAVVDDKEEDDDQDGDDSDEADGEEEDNEDDTDDDAEVKDEEDESADEEASKKELNQPKKATTTPKPLTQNERKLLRVNQELESLKREKMDIGDTTKFESEVDGDVKAVGKESGSTALAGFLGGMWKELRMFGGPFYNQYLSAAIKNLTKEEASLQQAVKKEADSKSFF